MGALVLGWWLLVLVTLGALLDTTPVTWDCSTDIECETLCRLRGLDDCEMSTLDPVYEEA